LFDVFKGKYKGERVKKSKQRILSYLLVVIVIIIIALISRNKGGGGNSVESGGIRAQVYWMSLF
jgi:uncharacterized protein